MPIPSSPAPLRAAGEDFQPRDLAGLALLCARSWGVPRAAVMERLESTDWEEAERRLSEGRPVSLDLGAVDLLASRTFRSGLGASRPDPGSPVPGHLFCGVRPLGDGRMEAAMAACPDRAFLSGHPEYRTCGAVTLSACGIPGILGPALHRRLDLDLGPMKAAPRDAVSRLPAWCTEENFAGTAALILSAVAVNGHPVFSGSPADRLRNLRENRLDGVFHISSARAAAGAIRGFGTDPAEIRLAASYDSGLDEIVWRACAFSTRSGRSLFLGIVRAGLSGGENTPCCPAAPAALLLRQAEKHLSEKSGPAALLIKTIIAAGGSPAADHVSRIFLKNGSVHVLLRGLPGRDGQAEIRFGTTGPALYEEPGKPPAAVPFSRFSPETALASLMTYVLTGRLLSSPADGQERYMPGMSRADSAPAMAPGF